MRGNNTICGMLTNGVCVSRSDCTCAGFFFFLGWNTGIGWTIGELGFVVTRAPSRVLPRMLLMWLPVLLLGACMGAFFGIAKPQTIWLPTNDVFSAASGSMFALVLLILAFAAAATSFYSTSGLNSAGSKSIQYSDDDALINTGLRPSPSASGYTASLWSSKLSDNFRGIVLLLLFLCLQVFVTACFSAVWNYSFHSYAGAVSPFSLVDK